MKYKWITLSQNVFDLTHIDHKLFFIKKKIIFFIKFKSFIIYSVLMIININSLHALLFLLHSFSLHIHSYFIYTQASTCNQITCFEVPDVGKIYKFGYFQWSFCVFQWLNFKSDV